MRAFTSERQKMIEKIKAWWRSRRKNYNVPEVEAEFYTREQIENAYRLGYTDGRRDGLSIARQQAMASLTEIVKQSNRQPKP